MKCTVNKYVQSTKIFVDCMEAIPSPRFITQIVWWKNMSVEENESDEIH
jgi:hypothetical protein